MNRNHHEVFKIFRLKKAHSWFPDLEYKKLYLAIETDNGYIIKVSEGEYIGLPKRIVENSPKVFEPYDPNKPKPVAKKKFFRKPTKY